MSVAPILSIRIRGGFSRKIIQDGLSGRFIQEGLSGRFIQDGLSRRFIQEGLPGKLFNKAGRTLIRSEMPRCSGREVKD